jgi:dTDP-4-amino-4,6-dideoxy-D-galactose acyltransferase
MGPPGFAAHFSEKNVVEKLSWDSDFFGIGVARLKPKRIDASILDYVLAWCKKNEISCLYCEADIGHRETLDLVQHKEFKLVDVRIDLEVDLKRTNGFIISRNSDTLVRPFDEGDIPALETIAKQISQTSRYRLDPGFPEGTSERLYVTWIQKSCAGFADFVFIGEQEGKPVGFVTGKCEHEWGRLVLVGVNSQFAGRGIAPLIIKRALEWFEDKKIHRVRVLTQGRNVASQRLYQNCGFRTSEVTLFYHKWF